MVIACVGMLVPAAESRRAESLSLDISFFANGTITVTLPDGTPVSPAPGAATVIPAGFYTLVFSGPGGCTALPNFHLTGPGTNIVANMAEGAAAKTTNTANLLPSSTYVWSDDAFPGVDHSFTTSAVIEGSPPTPGTTGTSAGAGGKAVTSQDIVGSEVTPSRGTLSATVSAAGRLSLAYQRKGITALRAGRYTISVTDRSAAAGFTLEKVGHRAVRLTGAAFTGKHSASMDLTAGRWIFAGGPGEASYSIAVR